MLDTTPRTLAATELGDIAVASGVVYFLTSCCKASHKGAGEGVVCRACYAPITGRHAGWGALAADPCLAAELAELLRPSLAQFAEAFAGRVAAAAQ